MPGGRPVTTAIRLRRASKEDGTRLFNWRNDPSARRHYLDSAHVTRAEHDRWFASRLSNPRCRIYIAEDPAGRALGQLRLEQRRGRAEVSLSVARGARGRGIGTLMIRRAAAAARRDLGVGELVAYVRPDNVRSAVAFLKAGYRFTANGRRKGQQMYVFVQSPGTGPPRHVRDRLS
jgi:UDP-2,4-diacetamido-2,4,6-trideoxy-beta-L-altropyranose hydrolase